MKHPLCLLVCLLLLLQTAACGRSEVPSEKDMEQPVRFYYCETADETYGSETGALGWELRDLGSEVLSASEILELYFRGPERTDLRMPFPKGLKAERVQLKNGLLTVKLEESMNQVTGIDKTLTAACLVYTMTQFSTIDRVLLECSGVTSQGIWGQVLTAEDFLLLDDTAISDQNTVKLYFAEPDGRYLIEEVRSQAVEDEEKIPAYILEQLLKGPQEADSRAVIPEGIRVYEVRVSDGLCTVNLSVEFLRNMPQTHLEARLAVFSIVNALTELPQVERVQLLCSGTVVADYRGLDLSEPLYREETAVRTADGESVYDGSISLSCGGEGLLAEVPVLIRRSSGRSLPEDLLSALLSFETANGYGNPIPDGVMIMDLQTVNGLCTVTFNSAFALCDTDQAQADAAVCAVVGTLCSLEGVDRVKIVIHNTKLTHVDLSEPLAAEEAWYLS